MNIFVAFVTNIRYGGEQVGNNTLDIFWHPRAAHFSGIFAWKSTILFKHEMPLLDIALQLSHNKTRAPSKYSKTFKIFQNLQNIPKPSKYSKTLGIYGASQHHQETVKQKNTREHCPLNICSYISWIDKLSIQPIVTNIDMAVLSKNHFLSAMSQFTSDKYHLFYRCAAGWVGWWGGLGQSREGWHWEDEAALINQGPGSYHKSRQHRLNDLSCIKSEKFRALAVDILW